ncbi:winged helix-turn-helix domain-containing protein [Arthrobacter sp. R-11]|uniref:winged helix-turn-helix domain-containing protein n=1 Tax=Arthrobacter sp. R-11 TaxID=3404053 RepID=UPI003CF3AD94
MAVNVHSLPPAGARQALRAGHRPGPLAGAGSLAGAQPAHQGHPGLRSGLRPGVQARGLAVWVEPAEGQDIDPEIWAKAAEAVLARARRLAPQAELHLRHGAASGVVAQPIALSGRRSSLAVDLAADTVLLDGVPVTFTFMEHKLLRYLVENLSRPIPREELQRFLESLDCPGAAFRSIDVYVGRVRRKLGSARNAIATVRGGGYQFVPGPGTTVRGPAEYCI